MNAFARSLITIAALAAMATANLVSAHEPGPDVKPLHPAEPTVPAPQGSAPGSSTAFDDPLVRALVIGIAANILREAAAQPDPVEALGNAVERRVAAALADPNTMRLVESGLKEAFRDAPEALREPLALFAISVLRSMRRDVLYERTPQPFY